MSRAGRVAELARYAVREASRNRLAWVGAAAGALFLFLYAWGLREAVSHVGGGTDGDLSRALMLAGVAPLAFWPVTILAVALGAVLGAGLTAGELESQVALATLARPLSRGEWLFGKALGAGLVLSLTIAAVAAAFAAISAWIVGAAPVAWPAALGLAVLEGWVAFALAIALGTRLGGLVTLVTVVLVYGLSLVGQVLGFVAAFAATGNRALEDAATVVMLLFPASGLYARAAHLLSGANPFASLAAGPLGGGAPPTAALTYWSCAYVVALAALAGSLFARRELG